MSTRNVLARLASKALGEAATLADRIVPHAGTDLVALLPSGGIRKPLPNWSQSMKLIEISTKLVSVSALAVGCLAGSLRAGSLDWVALSLLCFSALCVDAGTTAFNSWFDFHSGVDSLSRNADTDKVIERHGLEPGWALLAALSLYLLGALAGWSLSYLRGWDILSIGMAGMAIGFFYNGGPRPLSSTPLGEVFAGGALGLGLTALADRVAGGSWSLSCFLVGLPSFFVVASILSVNNASDAEGDAAAGRKTLAVLAGSRFMRFFIPIEGLLALASAFLAWFLRALPLLAPIPLCIGALAALPVYRGMALRGFSPSTKGANMAAISLVLVILSVSLVAALAF